MHLRKSQSNLRSISFFTSQYNTSLKSHSKEIGGTGLGLSIVKHAVGALKGSVILRSEEGNGTEITLRFPKVHME